jgi:hypothetical protein
MFSSHRSLESVLNVERKTIEIPMLDALFDPASGCWQTQEMNARKSDGQRFEKKLQEARALEAQLQNGIATREVLFDSVRKEVQMILTDHLEGLEAQGFQARDLLNRFK